MDSPMEDPYSPGPAAMYSMGYSQSLVPAFRLDEGFSEDTRSQFENSTSTIDNRSAFEEWVKAQSEDARAGMSCCLDD